MQSRQVSNALKSKTSAVNATSVPTLTPPSHIDMYGTPGNDLGAFMNGPKVTVYGNAQDGCGNTMNEGEIVIHGHAGDVTGHSMRGGRIFVKDYVGYRVGIHMKEYQKKIPNHRCRRHRRRLS